MNQYKIAANFTNPNLCAIPYNSRDFNAESRIWITTHASCTSITHEQQLRFQTKIAVPAVKNISFYE